MGEWRSSMLAGSRWVRFYGFYSFRYVKTPFGGVDVKKNQETHFISNLLISSRLCARFGRRPKGGAIAASRVS